MRGIIILSTLAVIAFGNPIIYDGRVPFATKNSALDTSSDPFLTVYSEFLGHLIAPTPLWNQRLIPFLSVPTEQVISITIDNSSVFIPGSGPPQTGFRRTELIAQQNGSHTELNTLMETGPSDGSHVFGIQLGSPFTNPTGALPPRSCFEQLFVTPFLPGVWHNFAIEVDWDNRTLQVFYSINGKKLSPVTKILSNPTTQLGIAGQGDFHFGILKLPLVDEKDSVADQGDVVHHGVQEGTRKDFTHCTPHTMWVFQPYEHTPQISPPT
ncbi:hypothetical protein BD779DRAFT_1498361 [Infundibulicybe gibba]|nr:hypothetical protein BD779DRAFT_1498361 [Infundibulicybe gibba]